MKKELKIERDLYEILQILSVSQFEKTALTSLLDDDTLQNYFTIEEAKFG